MPFVTGSARTTGRVAEIRSPATGAVVTRVHRADAELFSEAIAAAAEAFETTRRLPSHRRAAILEGMAAGLAARAEETARTIAAEAGKPIRTARIEVERCGHTLRSAAEEARRLGGEILPLDVVPWGEGRTGLLRRVPLGVVAGITPFNFPLNLVAHKIAPALAAGNTVVVKPASQTPSPALLLAELAGASGAPAGAVNVLPASSDDARPLVEDERVALLSFTGSAEVGWGLRQRAGTKRVVLELGGNAAAIVCADADLPAAAQRLGAGAFSYAGQSCISVQRVFVESAAFDPFLDRLVASARALRVGDPFDEATDVGPLITARDAERAEAWIAEAVAAGARLVTGGTRRGAWLEPAVLVNTDPAMKVNGLEAFAPLVTVSRFDAFSGALAEVNRSRFGLQAGLFTHDARRIMEAWDTLEVGAVLVGDAPTWRVDTMPYGGVKASGRGREGIRWAIEEMTEPRLLVWNRG